MLRLIYFFGMKPLSNIFGIEPILQPRVVLYPLLIRIGGETVNPRPKPVTATLASPSLYIWAGPSDGVSFDFADKCLLVGLVSHRHLSAMFTTGNSSSCAHPLHTMTFTVTPPPSPPRRK